MVSFRVIGGKIYFKFEDLTYDINSKIASVLLFKCRSAILYTRGTQFPFNKICFIASAKIKTLTESFLKLTEVLKRLNLVITIK